MSQAGRRSKFHDRAKRIHGEKFVDHTVNQPYLAADQYWKLYVTDQESCKSFFKLYHPEMSEQVVEAFAHYIARAVAGEIRLPAEMTSDTPPENKWDYRKEVEE